jgi:hypothetical protein
MEDGKWKAMRAGLPLLYRAAFMDFCLAAATPAGVRFSRGSKPVVSLRSTHRLQSCDAFGMPEASRK